MKRLLEVAGFILLVVGAIFTSCSSNDVFDSTTENLKKDADTGMAITGRIYTSGTSRASSSTVDSIMKNGFDLYIYYKDPNPAQGTPDDTVRFFSSHYTSMHVDGKLIDKTSGNFYIPNSLDTNPDGVLTWPKDTTVYFVAAYMPANDDVKTDYNFSFGHLGIMGRFDGKSDVLVASASGQYTPSSATNSTVPSLTFNFKHATSQIAANVKAPNDLYTYVVDSVKVEYYIPTLYSNAYNGGTDGDTGYYDFTQSKWVAPTSSSAVDLCFYKYIAGGQRLTVSSASATELPDNFFVVPYVDATSICTLKVWYSVYNNGNPVDYTKPLLASTLVEKNVSDNLALGSNVKFQITLPVLQVVGGTVTFNPWGNSEDVTVDTF